MSIRTVLVVDHHHFNVDIFRTMLEREGFHVIDAPDPDEAVMALNAVVPDLVLTDYPLRLKNGQTLTEYVRAQEKLEGIPILSITSRVLPGVLEEAERAGVTAALPMPVAPRALIKVVNQLIDERLAQEGRNVPDPDES